MVSRSFTKTELQLSNFKKNNYLAQIDFAIFENNTSTHVHYLIQHEEILPRQKHDSYRIFADYGTDQFSMCTNDKGYDTIVAPLDSFSFKSIIPNQNKLKTTAKKHNKSLRQKSLLPNVYSLLTDVTSDDDDHICHISSTDQLNESTHSSTFKNLFYKYKTTNAFIINFSVLDTTDSIKLSTHTSQVITFYDSSFFKYKSYFQGFFLPHDFSLDLLTLQHQQTQDPVLKLYSGTSSTINRSPISEIPITPLTQFQPSPIHTPLVHIPNPESVAKCINYNPPKPGTGIKTAKIQPQLDIEHTPETIYSTDLELSIRSQINPTLKPLKKHSILLNY